MVRVNINTMATIPLFAMKNRRPHPTKIDKSLFNINFTEEFIINTPNWKLGSTPSTFPRKDS
jgi:hypothetical protein